MAFDDLQRPPLDAAPLRAALARRGTLWREVQVLESVPSTNALVTEQARAGAEEGLVVIAEHQTAGRGRLERTWTTPPRAALAFSLLLRPGTVPPERWPWLPLLAGVAVAEGVRRATGVHCDLKWPNDVMVGDRKLAGVLGERLDAAAGPVVVVGIGINVSTTAEELPGARATSLSQHDAATLDRSLILREVLGCFEALYRQWRAEHGDASRGLLESFVRRCGTIGRRVRVDRPGGDAVTGEATGVDSHGRLAVATEAGTVHLGAGDVVHVRDEAP